MNTWVLRARNNIKRAMIMIIVPHCLNSWITVIVHGINSDITIHSLFPLYSFGSLITSGSSASSALSANPFFFFSRPSYLVQDLEFRQACCVDVNFCSLYHERRPIERCFFYRPPFFSKSCKYYKVCWNLWWPEH